MPERLIWAAPLSTTLQPLISHHPKWTWEIFGGSKMGKSYSNKTQLYAGCTWSSNSTDLIWSWTPWAAWRWALHAFSEFTHRVEDQLNAKLWEVLKFLAMPQNYHTFGPIKKTPKSVHSSQMDTPQCFRWQPNEFFADGRHQLVLWWDTYLNSCGNFS